MSENILKTLVTSLYETSKIAMKGINRLLGLSTLDFRQLFLELNLCNKSKEHPILSMRTLRSIQKLLIISQ